MFIINSVGEGLGDCFLIEVGEEPVIRILVDGRSSSQQKNIEEVLSQRYDSQNPMPNIDIVIVTHMDADHIGGVIKLMKNRPEKFEDAIVIYNYVTKETISYKQAEEFEKLIKDHMVLSTYHERYPNILNKNIKICSAHVRAKFSYAVDKRQKECPVLTLLSPDKNGIDSVYYEYKDKRPKGKNNGDSKRTNKNSITFLLEYKDKKVLFTGDAYFNDVENVMSDFQDIDSIIIDLIKIPHHGAKDNNKGLVEFAEKHQCKCFLVTGETDWVSNGKIHPSKELIDAIVAKNVEAANAKKEGYKIYTKVNIVSGKISPINKDCIDVNKL